MKKSIFIFILVFSVLALAQRRNVGSHGPAPEEPSSLTAGTPVYRMPDSVNAAALLHPQDSLANDTTDTIPADSAKKKNQLDAPVTYEASDSAVYEAGTKYAYLYGNGKVTYQNIELNADHISTNMDTLTVVAQGTVNDTTKKVKGRPVFKQGSDTYESDSMAYNFKTRKAFITNVTTQEGEGFLISHGTKKDSNNVMYMEGGKYTTCDAPHPHFYLQLSRAKVRPGKNIVFGPAWLVFEDVPLPLVIPFGFFPFNKKYSSGLLMPSYGDDLEKGFYLRDGGYYMAFNDNIDMRLTGEIYTKGSWGLTAASTYVKRYKYRGSFNVNYLVSKTGDKGMPDYAVTKDFRINWQHTQDSKASMDNTFSASVQFSTQNYDRNSLNTIYNPETYAQNMKQSSVNFSHNFHKIGLLMQVGMNLSSNSRDGSLDMTLPNLSLSLTKLYPFRRKNPTTKERWYEKISLTYNGTMENRVNTTEDKFLHTSLTKDWQNGFQHQVKTDANFTLFKYITITPSFNYNERWYLNRVERKWNKLRQQEDLDTIQGFNRVYDYSMNVSMNTTLYGFFKPWKKLFGDKIQMIRHMFKPSVTFSYAPDFTASRFGFYKTYVKTDNQGNQTAVQYSPYSGGLYGTAPSGKTGSLNFSISNQVEAKIKSDKDSTGFKKISLIDQFSANISYNMAARVRPWSDLTTSLRLKPFDNFPIDLTFDAVWHTYGYKVTKDGQIVQDDRTEWSHGRFGRFGGWSKNISYTFNNDTFKKLFGKKKDKNADGNQTQSQSDDAAQDTGTQQPSTNGDSDKKKEGGNGLDADGYMKMKFPWSINVSYGITLAEDTRQERFNMKTMRYPYKFSQQFNMSGSFQPTDGWNLTFSSGYDFDYHKISMTTLNFTRNLHCFTLSGGVVLFPYRTFNVTIRANAQVLTDALKYDKRSSYGSTIQWY